MLVVVVVAQTPLALMAQVLLEAVLVAQEILLVQQQQRPLILAQVAVAQVVLKLFRLAALVVQEL